MLVAFDSSRGETVSTARLLRFLVEQHERKHAKHLARKGAHSAAVATADHIGNVVDLLGTAAELEELTPSGPAGPPVRSGCRGRGDGADDAPLPTNDTFALLLTEGAIANPSVILALVKVRRREGEARSEDHVFERCGER